MRVLKGGHPLSVKDGKVQLDLLPVIDQVLVNVNERTGGRFASQIDSITDLTPDEARAKLSQALGRQLPDDFGTITVFEKQQLSSVQKAVELFNDLVYAIVIAGVGADRVGVRDRARPATDRDLGRALRRRVPHRLPGDRARLGQAGRRRS